MYYIKFIFIPLLLFALLLNSVQAQKGKKQKESAEINTSTPVANNKHNANPNANFNRDKGGADNGPGNSENAHNNRGQNKKRLSEKKYGEYIQRIFPDEADTAIDADDTEFNGRELAAPGEYPHMTALGFVSDDGDIDYKCGGSLISDKFVITAAHCTNVVGMSPTIVRIGDLNLKVEESYLKPIVMNIIHIVNHPNYKTNSHYNDIALLELEKEVRLSPYVRPIALWTQSSTPFPVAYAMGYGSTDFARLRTNRLTHLNMTIITNEACNLLLPTMEGTERGIIDSQICAKDYVLNRDTCQGDSGGPLQINLKGRRKRDRLHYYLIGITSYGLVCRSAAPSVYTRVYSYLDWIESIVWKDEV